MKDEQGRPFIVVREYVSCGKRRVRELADKAAKGRRSGNMEMMPSSHILLPPEQLQISSKPHL
jgi:hypothetical protein